MHEASASSKCPDTQRPFAREAIATIPVGGDASAWQVRLSEAMHPRGIGVTRNLLESDTASPRLLRWHTGSARVSSPVSSSNSSREERRGEECCALLSGQNAASTNSLRL